MVRKLNSHGVGGVVRYAFNNVSLHLIISISISISKLCLSTVKIQYKIQLHNNSNNNKYVSYLKSIFSKNTTHNYTKLQLKLNLFSMNAVYLTLLTKMNV